MQTLVGACVLFGFRRGLLGSSATPKLTSALDRTAARQFNEQAVSEGFAAFVTAQPPLRI